MKINTEEKYEKMILENNLLEKSVIGLVLATFIAANVVSIQEARYEKFHKIPDVITIDSIFNLQRDHYQSKIDSLKKIYLNK